MQNNKNKTEMQEKIMRFALATAMMAALAGCSTVEDPFLTGSVAEGNALAPALTQEVPVSSVIASLPGALGAPRSVRQTAPGGESTIRQEIVYANTTGLPGENVLTVEGGRGTDGRYLRVPTRNQLIGEMNRALPGVAMRISNVIGQNAYGVYGYATGPHAGGACIYGWQAVRQAGSNPTQVRLRFCHERMSEERIPMLMQGMTLRPLTGQAITMLRGIRGSSLAGAGPLLGDDALFDVPAPAASGVSRPDATEPSRPAVRPSVPAVLPVAAAPVLPDAAPLAPVLNAARVPMPGEKQSMTPVAMTASPQASQDMQQKAASAWNAARMKLAEVPQP